MTSPRTRRRVAAAGALAAGCLLAAIFALSLRGDDSPHPCKEAPYTPPLAAPGSGHPAQTFYTPGEEVPREDLAHAVRDGYLIVTYQPGISQAQQDALADWAVTADLVVVAPADSDQEDVVRAVTARRSLSCSEAEISSLTDFRDRWFDTARGRSPPDRLRRG